MPPPEINLTLDVLALAPKTRREYKNALLQFFEYCSRFNYTAHTAEELDTVLFDYIHFEFHSPGRDGRQHVNKVMSAIKHLVPEVRNALPRSHKCLTGWEVLRPSQQTTPCPHDLALAIALTFRSEERFDLSLAVLLCFDTMCRVSEILSLRRIDVIISRPPLRTVALDLGTETKTARGVRESVDVSTLLVRELLVRYMKSIPEPPGTKLFSFNDDQFREALKPVTARFFPTSSAPPSILPHSFRHGMATRLAMLKNVDVNHIRLRGRWKDVRERGFRRYLQVAPFLLTQIKTTESAHAYIKEVNADPGKFFILKLASDGQSLGVGKDDVRL